jgi:hypothetical protein
LEQGGRSGKRVALRGYGLADGCIGSVRRIRGVGGIGKPPIRKRCIGKRCISKQRIGKQRCGATFRLEFQSKARNRSFIRIAYIDDIRIWRIRRIRGVRGVRGARRGSSIGGISGRNGSG